MPPSPSGRGDLLLARRCIASDCGGARRISCSPSPLPMTMDDSRPRFALFADLEPDAAGDGWRFALHAADGSSTVTASDRETGADADRLVLLAVVRGLEALDQPSQVTVVTRSASVVRGFRRGLDAWRQHDWRWERHGRLTPIRDADLWRRVDHALAYHAIRCRTWGSAAAGDRDAVNLVGPTVTSPIERMSEQPSMAEDRLAGRIAHGRIEAGAIDPSRIGWAAPAMVIVQGRTRRRRRVTFAQPAAAAG